MLQIDYRSSGVYQIQTFLTNRRLGILPAVVSLATVATVGLGAGDATRAQPQASLFAGQARVPVPRPTLRSIHPASAANIITVADVPQDITQVSISPGTNVATLTFRTATPTVPELRVSPRQPDSVPSFHRSRTIFTGTPLYSGRRTGHRVRVRGLTPFTHYYYIITASDEKGMPVRVTGDFNTSGRID